jgi:hypothetical protein
MSTTILTPAERTEQRAGVLRALCISYLNLGHLDPAWPPLVSRLHSVAGRLLDAIDDENEAS